MGLVENRRRAGRHFRRGTNCRADAAVGANDAAGSYSRRFTAGRVAVVREPRRRRHTLDVARRRNSGNIVVDDCQRAVGQLSGHRQRRECNGRSKNVASFANRTHNARRNFAGDRSCQRRGCQRSGSRTIRSERLPTQHVAHGWSRGWRTDFEIRSICDAVRRIDRRVAFANYA